MDKDSTPGPPPAAKSHPQEVPRDPLGVQDSPAPGSLFFTARANRGKAPPGPGPPPAGPSSPAAAPGSACRAYATQRSFEVAVVVKTVLGSDLVVDEFTMLVYFSGDW